MHEVTSIHARCWELIPWVVNGRASDAEQEQVSAHVTRCDECRDELRRQRALHEHMQAPAEVGLDPHASWQKLSERLDEPALAEAERAPELRMRRRPWLWVALAAQAVTIVVLLGIILVPTLPNEAEYRTLSSVSAAPARADVRVVFAGTATIDEMRTLLRQVNAEVIAGPSEAGVYSLAIRRGSVANALGQLRSHPTVVFAEPSGELRGTSP